MSYYEPYSELSTSAKDVGRVITSLREELEAIDYYNQRADVTKDSTVAGLMIHNRNEEIEHAVMLIEWLRRTIPEFDKELRQYLFTEGSLLEMEEGAAGGEGGGGGPASLGIGSLKK